MKIKPLNDKILIEITKPESKTSSGIIIPVASQEKTQEGIIREISEDVKDSLIVKVGEKVMYDKYAGTPVKIDDKDYLIVDLADVIAIIE